MPAAGAGMAFAGTPGRRAALTDKGFDVLDSQAIQLMYQALWLVLLLSAPPVLAAALVGLVIALIQAATQIQEATLAFVPKIIAMFLALLFAFPWIMDKLITYTRDIFLNLPNYIRGL